MARTPSPRLVAPLLGALALGGGSAAWVGSIAREVKQPVDLPRVSYATSATCVPCHPGRFETWHRTFHRTMTQRANRATVLGDFTGASLTYGGVTSRFGRDGDRHWIETLSPGGTIERHEVVLTVGSRRVQQYVTRVDDRHVRLPLAWNIEEKRWIHLNGGFLDPDGTDFNAHRTTWDTNCIFCHNVKARPRYDPATARFDARVEELGVACEACHGPGELHVRRNANPLRRYLLHLSGDEDDPTIHSPADLPPLRRMQVCGHCHGQRLPNPPQRIAEFMTVGDPYTAGEDLARFTTPIDVHSELPGVDLTLRFWKDGTPRLTAHEYQGLLQSRGHEDTELTCISCHDMHGGDPRGMIRPEMRGPLGCVQCHGDIGRNVAAHTKHEATGTGSDCYACHMPPTTYGLLAVHPSHRITSPDPARAWRDDMPEACTLCHVDRTAAWAAREAARQYGHPAPGEPPAGRGFEFAEGVRSLFAGDVVQRTVAVEALTRERSFTEDGAARLWAVPFLLLALEDRYPAIRHVAFRGLVEVCRRAETREPGARAARTLPRFDYLADPPARAAALERWWAWWRTLDKSRIPRPPKEVPLDADWIPTGSAIASLRARQDDRPIAIGE